MNLRKDYVRPRAEPPSAKRAASENTDGLCRRNRQPDDDRGRLIHYYTSNKTVVPLFYEAYTTRVRLST
jgi:hypothetical protein